MGEKDVIRVGTWSRRYTDHGYLEWFVFTLGLGVLPIIIRLLVSGLCSVSIEFDDFRAELFFLTIVFLVDAVKNYGMRSVPGSIAMLILVLCSSVYGVIVIDDLDVFSLTISSSVNRWSTWLFLVAGSLLDGCSVLKDGG